MLIRLLTSILVIDLLVLQKIISKSYCVNWTCSIRLFPFALILHCPMTDPNAHVIIMLSTCHLPRHFPCHLPCHFLCFLPHYHAMHSPFPQCVRLPWLAFLYRLFLPMRINLSTFLPDDYFSIFSVRCNHCSSSNSVSTVWSSCIRLDWLGFLLDTLLWI